jgi:hypothetical protein
VKDGVAAAEIVTRAPEAKHLTDAITMVASRAARAPGQALGSHTPGRRTRAGSGIRAVPLDVTYPGLKMATTLRALPRLLRPCQEP